MQELDKIEAKLDAALKADVAKAKPYKSWIIVGVICFLTGFFLGHIR